MLKVNELIAEYCPTVGSPGFESGVEASNVNVTRKGSPTLNEFAGSPSVMAPLYVCVMGAAFAAVNAARTIAMSGVVLIFMFRLLCSKPPVAGKT